MKVAWNKYFDLLFYMVAGVGLFSLLNLIFKEYSELPALLVLIGLGLGFLMWRRETKAMKEMDFGGNDKALKLYVYLFQLFVYVLSFFGFTELFSLIFGQSSIEAYESYTISWKSFIFLLIIIAGWKVSAERIIEDIKMNVNIQKA
jgi:hypothetical protein